MQSADTAINTSRNLSELAYDNLKRDILAAALIPGERLKLDALSVRYGIGVVPLREALNRLSSEGFVVRKSQRGFEVATMSLVSLEELVKTRIWLETKALSESVAKATPAWEEALVLAHHRLSRTERLTDAPGHGQRHEQPHEQRLNGKWEEVHKSFHMQLIANCGSSWLLEFCSTMMDQSVRYRNHSVNISKGRSGKIIANEHKQLLDAVLDRDAQRSADLLQAHYLRTLDTLRGVLG